jgi:hypothetical protein
VKLPEPQNRIARAMLSDPIARLRIESYLKNEVDKLDLSQMVEMFKGALKTEKIIMRTAKDGQTKGLPKVVSARQVLKRFAAQYWTKVMAKDDNLILGDTCVWSERG